MARKRKKYSPEVKVQVVEEYKAGKGCLRSICKKYGIKDHKTLRGWISCYNGQKIFRKRSSARGEIYMTKGRKTTQEERAQIVAFCIEHGKDYAIERKKGTTNPKFRGRKPAKTLQEYKYENKRLKMENELLRGFLSLTERM